MRESEVVGAKAMGYLDAYSQVTPRQVKYFHPTTLISLKRALDLGKQVYDSRTETFRGRLDLFGFSVAQITQQVMEEAIARSRQEEEEEANSRLPLIVSGCFTFNISEEDTREDKYQMIAAGIFPADSIYSIKNCRHNFRTPQTNRFEVGRLWTPNFWKMLVTESPQLWNELSEVNTKRKR